MRQVANVIRAELFKTVRKRRSYLLAGLLWLVIPALLVFIGWLLQTRVAGTFVDEGESVREIIQAVASPFGIARNAFLLFGNLSPSLLIIVVALLATLLMGEERSQNMWKTVLVAAPNRLAVLAGKFVTAMLLLGVLMAGGLASGTLFGAIGMLFLPTSFAGEWGGLVKLYALQWAFGASAMLFGFLLVWWIRSQPLAVVAILFLPAIVEGAYGFYRTVVGFERLNRLNAILQALQLRNTLEELPRYFFTTNLYAPAREPLAQLGRLVGAEFGAASGPFAGLLAADVNRAAWVMAVYGVIFAALLVISFVRSDIT